MNARRSSARLAAVWVALLAWSVGCDAGPATDGDGARAALMGARSGDEVRLAAGRFEGPFTVPAGVRLVGEGAGTVLVAPADGVAVELEAGVEATTLASVAVESAGRGGVIARGAGAATIRDVSVSASAGIAVGAEGLSSLTMERVRASGPVTAENAAELPAEPTAAETAVYGIVLIDIGDAALSDVSADGFADIGLAALRSQLLWAGGGADHNRGTGVFLSGGSSTLTDLRICGTVEGVRLPPAYGAVAAGGAQLTTMGLTVCDNQGNGFLHDDAAAQHTSLTASGNGFGALWVQSSSSFLLDGSSSLSANAFAGLVGVSSSGIAVTGATIDMQSTARRVFDETRAVDVGDGVHLVGSTVGVTLSDVTLVGNERVGVLLDGAGASLEAVSLSGVSVEGSGGQLGIVAQNGATAAGWDDGVARGATVAANDLAFTGTLDVVSIVGPSRIPAEAAFGDGLDAIVGPSR